MARVGLIAFSAIFAFMFLVANVSSKSIPRRSIRELQGDDASKYVSSKSATPKQICSKSAPCGWEIYVPFTKEIVDYMPNTCDCSLDMQCTRVDDDISVSAFVHRCRPTIPKPHDLQNSFS